MTWKDRWDLLLVALGRRTGSLAEAILQIHKAAKTIVAGLEDQLHFAGLDRTAFQEQEDLLRERIRHLELEIAEPGKGRSGIAKIVQHNDAVGDLTVLCRRPDGQLEELRFDTSKPRSCPVPDGFRVLQIGAISPVVPFENPSSPGALVANAMRRFNDNVLRFPDFKGIVRDEGMQKDGNDLGASTVLLEFGKRKYEIVVTCKERLTVPDGAIADPKIVDPRAG